MARRSPTGGITELSGNDEIDCEGRPAARLDEDGRLSMQFPQAQSDGGFKYLFEDLSDPVVKFRLDDGQPTVVQANDAFVDVFGTTVDTVVGKPLNELIVPSDKQQEAVSFDQRTGSGETNAAIVERKTGDGKRTFAYRGVPYTTDYGFAIYTDITDEVKQQKHLDVLHRVLRHNLRNELTVVLGHIEPVIKGVDNPELKSSANTVKQAATRLTQLSEEAKTIERVLGETATTHPVELQPMVDDVVNECAGRFDSASISADVPSDIGVHADEKLQIVLRSLLDNAIRHNDADNPRANVHTVIPNGTTVEIAVVDNGPGIPPVEQQIITDTTDITPLTHGSGLGLWLVRWIVDAYGGTLDIETPPSGGSVVRLQLQRVDTS